MKLHGGPNLARGPEFDTHAIDIPNVSCSVCKILTKGIILNSSGDLISS